jgi:hypothetical protein
MNGRISFTTNVAVQWIHGPGQWYFILVAVDHLKEFFQDMGIKMLAGLLN